MVQYVNYIIHQWYVIMHQWYVSMHHRYVGMNLRFVSMHEKYSHCASKQKPYIYTNHRHGNICRDFFSIHDTRCSYFVTANYFHCFTMSASIIVYQTSFRPIYQLCHFYQEYTM